MATKVKLAPNPNRSMAIDRVVIIGRSSDGGFVDVLSIDGLQSDEYAKRQFSRYFMKNANWNLVALFIIIIGIAASFVWRWWSFIPGFVVSGWAGFQGKISGATAGERILADHPSAREKFAERGLIWTASVKSVVDS